MGSVIKFPPKNSDSFSRWDPHTLLSVATGRVLKCNEELKSVSARTCS